MWRMDRLNIYSTPDPFGSKYPEYSEYQNIFDKVGDKLVKEWNEIEETLREKYDGYGRLDLYIERWKGYLYEALFYLSCIRRAALFLDAEHLKLAGWMKSNEYPPWFSCIPLYDVIPGIPHIGGGNKREPKVPQTKADFLVFYVDDKGPTPPALIDVKSKKPKSVRRFGWQIVAAMRKGFIFQIAYPRNNVEYPKTLKEWEIRTPCPKCGKLSRDYRECDKCGEEIFPYTIVDAYYRFREIIEKQGYKYRGRF